VESYDRSTHLIVASCAFVRLMFEQTVLHLPTYLKVATEALMGLY
jgi:hypothetical protein